MRSSNVFACVSAAACLFAGVAAASAASVDDSLFRDLGGRAGIANIVNLTTDNFLADARIKQNFGNTNIDRLKAMLADWFCVVSGGPCEYTGHTMLETHRGLRLKNSDFNVVVEDLQTAMEQAGVPFRVQNRLLARLAPMQRDIVTR